MIRCLGGGSEERKRRRKVWSGGDRYPVTEQLKPNETVVGVHALIVALIAIASAMIKRIVVVAL